MKLLGHVYIAVTAFPDQNKDLLAFGALLPETVFYTKPQVLTFAQIHEGGLELYNFCKTHAPEFVDLGIGSMTHSVKYGADSYNSLESLIPLGFNDSDIPRIAEAIGVELHIAKARAHNLYDLVLDYFINKKYPHVKQVVENTKQLNIIKISQILADCYKVDGHAVYYSLTNLWKKYDLTLMETFEGLATFWKLLANDLVEKDPVDIDKTAMLLTEFYTRLEPAAEDFLNEVVSTTRAKVSEVI
jgi:hypothetical protein